jgi:hypothetical protein
MGDRGANRSHAANLTRIAWLVSLAAPALLIGLLSLAKIG